MVTTMLTAKVMSSIDTNVSSIGQTRRRTVLCSTQQRSPLPHMRLLRPCHQSHPRHPRRPQRKRPQRRISAVRLTLTAYPARLRQRHHVVGVPHHWVQPTARVMVDRAQARSPSSHRMYARQQCRKHLRCGCGFLKNAPCSAHTAQAVLVVPQQ